MYTQRARSHPSTNTTLSTERPIESLSGYR
jgi:hypothetical protein